MNVQESTTDESHSSYHDRLEASRAMHGISGEHKPSCCEKAKRGVIKAFYFVIGAFVIAGVMDYQFGTSIFGVLTETGKFAGKFSFNTLLVAGSATLNIANATATEMAYQISESRGEAAAHARFKAGGDWELQPCNLSAKDISALPRKQFEDAMQLVGEIFKHETAVWQDPQTVASQCPSLCYPYSSYDHLFGLPTGYPKICESWLKSSGKQSPFYHTSSDPHTGIRFEFFGSDQMPPCIEVVPVSRSIIDTAFSGYAHNYKMKLVIEHVTELVREFKIRRDVWLANDCIQNKVAAKLVEDRANQAAELAHLFHEGKIDGVLMKEKMELLKQQNAAGDAVASSKNAAAKMPMKPLPLKDLIADPKQNVDSLFKLADIQDVPDKVVTDSVNECANLLSRQNAVRRAVERREKENHRQISVDFGNPEAVLNMAKRGSDRWAECGESYRCAFASFAEKSRQVLEDLHQANGMQEVCTDGVSMYKQGDYMTKIHEEAVSFLTKTLKAQESGPVATQEHDQHQPWSVCPDGVCSAQQK